MRAAARWGAQAVTPFETDVAASINDGLTYLTNQGVFNNPPPAAAGPSAGLTMLALLEKRASGDPNDPPQGYDGASAADQALLRTAAAYIISEAGNTGIFDETYVFGNYIMGLALYMRTGGPCPPRSLQ